MFSRQHVVNRNELKVHNGCSHTRETATCWNISKITWSSAVSQTASNRRCSACVTLSCRCERPIFVSVSCAPSSCWQMKSFSGKSGRRSVTSPTSMSRRCVRVSLLLAVPRTLLSASLYVSKRGAYWDRLCRDVVGRWLVGWLVVTRVHCGQTVHPRPIVTMEH